MKTTDIFRTLTSNASRAALAFGLAGALGLAAPAVSFAQDGAPQAERGEARGQHHGRHHRRGGMRGHLRRMAAELELSDAQREQIRGILQEARAQRAEGHSPGMRRQVHARIQAVLTPEQRLRADELRNEHQREHLERRLSRMSERLELSERQQQQVRGILRNAAMQRRALFEQGENDPESARAAMRGLHERTTASIRSVLNAEQQSTFDEMVERRQQRRGRGHHGRGFGRGHGPGPRGGR